LFQEGSPYDAGDRSLPEIAHDWHGQIDQAGQVVTLFAPGLPKKTSMGNLEERNAFAMLLNDTVRQALTSGHIAHLVTLNPDGSPQVSLVWVGLDGDEIVCGHLSVWKKVQNIRNDTRVALSMETGGVSGGMENYLVISGRAYITEGGAPELLHRLAQVYRGPGTNFPPAGAPGGYITHIEVESVYGVGPWKTQS
jgi:PPOX class probable F420-dependent enzyme